MKHLILILTAAIALPAGVALPAAADDGAALSAVAASAERPEKKANRDTKRRKKRAKKPKWPERRTAFPAGVDGMPTMGNIPFQEGERLVFKVELLGTEAGEAMLGVGRRAQHNGRWVVPLSGWLRSGDFLSKFYPINDRITTVVDEQTFLPISVDFDVHEQDRKRRYITRFDQGNQRLRWEKTTGTSKKKLKRSWSFPHPMYDVLSAIYMARRVDLKPGLKFGGYAWDFRRERQVVAEVVSRERVWTYAGWYDAYKIKLTSKITAGFTTEAYLDQPAKVGWVWIADDPWRTPVKIESPTKLGSIKGTLSRRFVEMQDVAQR